MENRSSHLLIWHLTCLAKTENKNIKHVSEVGFEPTPTFVDQNTPYEGCDTLSLAP